VDGYALRHIAGLTALSSLNLTNTYVSDDALLGPLANMTALTFLDLSYNTQGSLTHNKVLQLSLVLPSTRIVRRDHAKRRCDPWENPTVYYNYPQGMPVDFCLHVKYVQGMVSIWKPNIEGICQSGGRRLHMLRNRVVIGGLGTYIVVYSDI
jgi:hypothetical protein